MGTKGNGTVSKENGMNSIKRSRTFGKRNRRFAIFNIVTRHLQWESRDYELWLERFCSLPESETMEKQWMQKLIQGKIK